MLQSYTLQKESTKSINRDYQENMGEASDFFTIPYHQEGSYELAAKKASEAYRGDRESLVQLLLKYNQEIGCSNATITQVEKLKDPRSVAILCGQQAGFLTGPLFTVYKAMMAVKLAAKLELQLQRPVVPVFWVAAEDHDLSEVNHCYVPDQNYFPQRITIDLPHHGEPIGKTPLPEDISKATLESFANFAQETEFMPSIISMLEDARAASDNVADWFARIMSKLFEHEGLIIFNPLIQAARKIAAPLFVQAINMQEEIEQTLSQREDSILSAGYNLQVQRTQDATLLMLMQEKRAALLYKEGHYFTKDGKVTYTKEELIQLAVKNPEYISPNVLLRPLMQDLLFPTCAFIAGPGEAAYFAQALALYPLFDQVPPVIVPRVGLTIVEPRLDRYRNRYNISGNDLLGDLESILQNVLRQENDVELDVIFANLRQKIKEEYEVLKNELARLNPQLTKLTEKNLQHLYSQISYLEDKAEAEYKKKNEATIRHFAQLKNSFSPQEKPQERVYNFLTYLIKYGPGFWQQLLEEFPTHPGHYLYFINK